MHYVSEERQGLGTPQAYLDSTRNRGQLRRRQTSKPR
jgi:hypothetical protein